jgi:cardiolipin synthase
VPRPVRRAWPGLAAALAVAGLCTTGCNLQVSSAASDPSSHHKSVHHTSGQHAAHQHKAARHRATAGGASKAAVTLVTEPGDGFSPVYRLISEAKHSIDITMYEFADTTAEHDLAAAARRGVSVHVILDQREKSLNTRAYDYFRSRRVKVSWSSPSYEYTHQKTMVIDQSEAVIMTANLTSEYYSTSRDFLVTDTNHRDIAAITRVFDADFAHRAVTPGDGHDLVWSPTDAQARLLGLINGASKSLRIYSEEMGDSTIVDALIAAARRGVSVQLCAENTDREYDSDFARLSQAGVRVSYFSSSDGFYVHGKVIEADYGTPRARAFIGSENFSATSLDRNRELGLITSSRPILASIARTFAADFANGTHWA